MKRYRPKSATRHRRPGPGLKGLFGQPVPEFYRLPELEIRAGTVLTDGCRRVLEFTPERISLDMGRFVITLYGTQLRIESLAGRRASVGGKVERIDFRQKWGDGDARG